RPLRLSAHRDRRRQSRRSRETPPSCGQCWAPNTQPLSPTRAWLRSFPWTLKMSKIQPHERNMISPGGGSPMSMQAAILDFDGVLVDSEPLHYRAMHAALLPEGITINPGEYAREYIGYNDREAMRRALSAWSVDASRERVEALVKRKAERY